MERYSDPARGAPPPRAGQVLTCEMPGGVAVAVAQMRKRGARAPARRERVCRAEELVVPPELGEIPERVPRAPLRQPQHAARLQQGVARHPRRDGPLVAADAERQVGLGELATLDQRRDEPAKREWPSELDVVLNEELEPRARIGLGARDGAAPQ